ncbi:hypothetical protein ElyMa_000079500 [Elysia marginata]|uniref:Uncharacterized protein n=1 Tax=Elysia marginata TaxID=1093978 RepID=A0AAV4EHC6_9GAST|nr:hypothetical protein ElyMa_000079500 [Elysia marginata]
MFRFVVCRTYSTIAWSHVQDEKGGGLGVELATPSCKITNAAETVEERNSTQGGRSKAGQVTGIMTGMDESREKVSTRTASLLTPKQPTRRPKETWRRTVEKDLKERRPSLETASPPPP